MTFSHFLPELLRCPSLPSGLPGGSGHSPPRCAPQAPGLECLPGLHLRCFSVVSPLSDKVAALSPHPPAPACPGWTPSLQPAVHLPTDDPGSEASWGSRTPILSLQVAPLGKRQVYTHILCLPHSWRIPGSLFGVLQVQGTRSGFPSAPPPSPWGWGLQRPRWDCRA